MHPALLCLLALPVALTVPPRQEGLTKADIAMAVMDGVGGALNNLATRLEADFDEAMARLPGMTPPGEWPEFADEPPRETPGPGFSDEPFIAETPSPLLGDVRAGADLPGWHPEEDDPIVVGLGTGRGRL